MQAFSALFSGVAIKKFVFLDICPRITQIYTDSIILNSQSHTDATDFHRFFLQLQGNRCWVESSLFSAHKVIIPLSSPLSVLNSKCAEQPSGNSEDVQSFPDGIVVRAGKATGSVLSRLSHRRHIWADLGVCGLESELTSANRPQTREKGQEKQESSQPDQRDKSTESVQQTVINKTTTNQGSKESTLYRKRQVVSLAYRRTLNLKTLKP